MAAAFRRFIRRGCAAIVPAALVLLALLQPLRAADVAALRGKHIVLVEPYGPGSVTNFPLMLMRDEIARKSGAAVDIVSVGGQAGGSALDYVLSPPPDVATDAVVFAVLDVISRQLAETVDGRIKLLAAMQPVATVSGPLSVALVVPERSDIKTVDDLIARARARPLRIVNLGRRAGFGLELAMLEKEARIKVEDKAVGTRAEILAALESGEADAGFLVTFTLLQSAEAAAPPVRPLLTFGARRHPSFPEVPTFKESVGQDKKGTAITGIIAVFTPRRTPKPVVAAMAALLREVAAEPAIKQAAASHKYPLAVAPATTVSEEVARGARMIKQHRAYLDR